MQQWRTSDAAQAKRMDELASDAKAQLEAAKAFLASDTDAKIASQLKAAEEKEACEEAVQRMIEALEEREAYELPEGASDLERTP